MEEEEGVIQSLKLDSDPNIGAKLTEFNLRHPDQYQFEYVLFITRSDENTPTHFLIQSSVRVSLFPCSSFLQVT